MKLLSRIICIILCLSALLGLMPLAQAAETEARDISDAGLVTKSSGVDAVFRLFDKRTIDFVRVRQGSQLILSSQEGIGSLYLQFGLCPGKYTVKNEDSGQTRIWGENGFAHEFLDLEEAFGEAPKTVTLSFDSGEGKLAEIHVFTSGEVPDFVQKWELPANAETDLVLFSTHGDDEQLFFAGVLPYYAVERDCRVQVVYLTDHRNVTLRRVGEMLNGLWAVGIRSYPVFGSYGDYHSTSLSEARQIYRNKGISEAELLTFVVENIRRFRPKVVVGHDLNGEYGHGMHMLYADLLCQAVNCSMDPDAFPESAEKYGVWDVPKTYLHLYSKNKIVMDWDQPMAHFGGMTPFEVTRDLGFPCHTTQQEYYAWYISGRETAGEIRDYSPCKYGLYRSTVGEDIEKNDFFENVSTYAQDTRLELEFLAQTEETQIPETSETTVPAETMAVQPAPEQPLKGEEIHRDPIVFMALGASGVLLLVSALITKAMGPGRKNKK